MKSKREKLEAVEQALLAAGRRARRAAPSAGWQDAVMQDVRRMKTMSVAEEGSIFLGRFAWRLSAIAAGVAIALLIFAMSQGFVDYEELAMRFLEDPARFLI